MQSTNQRGSSLVGAAIGIAAFSVIVVTISVPFFRSALLFNETATISSHANQALRSAVSQYLVQAATTGCLHNNLPTLEPEVAQNLAEYAPTLSFSASADYDTWDWPREITLSLTISEAPLIAKLVSSGIRYDGQHIQFSAPINTSSQSTYWHLDTKTGCIF